MEIQTRKEFYFSLLKRLLVFTCLNFMVVAIGLLVASKLTKVIFNAENFGMGLWYISLAYFVPMFLNFESGIVTDHVTVEVGRGPYDADYYRGKNAALKSSLIWLIYGGLTFCVSYLFIL